MVDVLLAIDALELDGPRGSLVINRWRFRVR